MQNRPFLMLPALGIGIALAVFFFMIYGRFTPSRTGRRSPAQGERR